MSLLTCASRIASVQVYARGAAVTRRIELPEALPAEACELLVRDLSPQAEAGSLRAELVGERAVVALTTRLVVPDAPGAPGELEAERRALERRLERLRAEHSLIASRREGTRQLHPRLILRRRAEDPLGRTRDALGASAIVLELLEELDRRTAELDAEVAAAERELRGLRLRIEQAEAERVRRADERTREVTLRLGPGEGTVQELNLGYVVRAARWWPAYTARLSEGGARCAWSLEAFVAQSSGEDWREVALTLSTADLVADARLPELRSLRLSRSQPPPKRGFRPPPEGLDALFEGYDTAGLPAPARPSKPKPRPAPPPPEPEPVFEELAADMAMESEAFELMDDDDEADGVARDVFKARKRSAPRAQAKSGFSLFGRGGGGGPPPAPSAAPASAMRLTRSGAALGGPPGGGPADAPAQPAALEPADAWLNFDSLVLGPNADRARRGRLTRNQGLNVSSRIAQAGQAIDGLANPRFAQDPLRDRGLFDYAYPAEGLVDVPANAQRHRVQLSSADAEGRTRLRCVPREDDAVFREVELDNPFGAPLLGGPTEVFFDGALLTTSRIAPTGRGGSILLGLGTEDRVRVARNVAVEESTVGLLGGTTEIHHRVTIELNSSLGGKVPIVLVDRVPVPASEDEDLEVELVSSEPRAMRYKQLDRDGSGGHLLKGGLRWDLELEPGAKRTVRFSYKIVLASKRIVVGGNRRD